jgi:hypothetical protein
VVGQTLWKTKPDYVSRGMMKMSSAMIKSTPTITPMTPLKSMSLLSPA